MAFWQKCLLFLFLFQQVAEAQSILMIEDQTESGFKLVMNNFIQNETALPKLNLQKFPNETNEVIILLNSGKRIQQKLPAFKKGIHKYVIYRDYSGATKLRYRGIYNELVQSAIMFDYSEEIPWVDTTVNSIAQNDTNSRYEAWKKENLKAENTVVDNTVKTIEPPKKEVPPLRTEPGTDADSTKKAPAIAISEKPETLPEPSPKKDSLLVLNTDTTKSSQDTPYLNFSTKFMNSNFEFDKLQMAKDYGNQEKISEEQMVEILSNLKYDQSRIDLLRTLLAQQNHLLKSEAKLIACLDYDLSKQEAKKLFTP